MATSAGQAGVALADAKDYAAALPKLNEALKTSSSPAWLLARSKCHVAQSNFTAALDDAEAAYISASSRGSRPLMVDAQYRRAVSLFRLGNPADADLCGFWTMQLAEGVSVRDEAFTDPAAATSGFWRPDREALLQRIKSVTAPASQGEMTTKRFGSIWNTAAALRAQIIATLDKLGPEDPGRKVTVKLMPEERKKEQEKDEDELVKEAVAEREKAIKEARGVEAKPREVRVDFFQSITNMSVSVFAKGVPKDTFQAEMTSDKVRLSHIPGHEPWYEIPLHGRIDPSQSKYTVTPNKVELSLRKAEPVKWPTLRADATSSTAAAPSAPQLAPEMPKPAAAASTPAAPSASVPSAPSSSSSGTNKPAAAGASSGTSYPTSSRGGAKNWDKVLEDEDVEDKESVNEFFKTLYAGATDEQKRAMMKSFTESNGTSLSTNWDDVKDRQVETMPPEGVEAKKW